MQEYFKEARNLLALAIPVIFAQISQTAMGVVDTIMSGSVSANDMAAVAVGTALWLPVILFGHGLLLSLTPIIAQLNGSGRRNKIPHHISQGYWLAIAISFILMIILYNSNLLINNMPQVDTVLAAKSVAFLRGLLWGTPGYLLFQVLRCQCDGLSKTKPGMVICFLGLISNIPLNYILINGKLGLPVLGGIGCGIATASVYWILFIVLRWYIRRASNLRDLNITILQQPDFQLIWRLLRLGLPIALALFFEVTLFALVALLVAPLGIIAIASHQIAFNFSSLMFVLPLSLSVAATIRVGYRLGEGNVEQARISAWTSLIIGVTLAMCSALLTILLRQRIALLYNDSSAVVAMASHLMLFAAIYQISDSLQVIGSGVLRGYQDTRAIFFMTFTAYWLLGFPCGYILAFTDLVFPAMGASGFWIGFIIGLTSAAILIILRIRWLQNQTPEYILRRATCGNLINNNKKL